MMFSRGQVFRLAILLIIPAMLDSAAVAQSIAKNQERVRIGFLEGFDTNGDRIDDRYGKLYDYLQTELDIGVVPLREQFLTNKMLSSIQILIFPKHEVPLTADDLAALDTWIIQGGILLFLHDINGYAEWRGDNIWQFLADYGIRAQLNGVTGPSAHMVTFNGNFGTKPYQIKKVACDGTNCFLSPINDAQILSRNPDNRLTGLYNPAVGRGRVIVIGDSDCWSNDFFEEADNKKFLINTIHYGLPMVDLKLIRPKISSEQGEKGQTIIISLKIKNTKKSPSVATTILHTLEPAEQENGKPCTLVETRLPAIPGKKRVRIKIEANVPKRISAGQYHMRVVVDPQGLCKDNRRANNEFLAKAAVRIQ